MRIIFNIILDQVEIVIVNPPILFGIFFLLAMANLFCPPIPLETATLFAGYLAGTGHGSLLLVILATTGGMFSGSLLLYRFIKKYGIALFEKAILGKVTASDLYKKAFDWFERFGLWAILLGKLVPGMSLATVICCGILRLEVKKVVWPFLLSNLFFFSGLALIGNLLGAKWGNALSWLTKIGVISLLLMMVFAFGVIIHYLFRRNQRLP